MKLYLFILAILTAVVSTGAQVKHRDTGMFGCFDTKQGEYFYALDGDEMGHADYVQKKFFMTLPEFAAAFSYGDDMYADAEGKQGACKQNIQSSIKGHNNPEEVLEPPTGSLYPRNDVTLGMENRLICHVTGFFPPALKVRWTRNNEDVREGVAVSQFQPNKDGTFNMFSTLSITPEQGDIYTCTVEHQALQQPLTKEWDADSEITVPSIGPSVFCGVGLTVGLLGVAVGTFFLVKGNNCN
ncbi:RLA class II histocompatibility antigen, DP alpha-1 chain [Chanos chanos]|uniref:RLA class II histocompatibility antigen, DP alpha-1 chain n=1 Tax=Chanos chanos TaxID=29144 RepID=A0A6J2WMN9_CHACN|nr:RLA class II histocompatibility antigen, DP alpha-1 chain-like [Chanos chanos]